MSSKKGFSLDALDVVRGRDIPGCPDFAKHWGWVRLVDLNILLGRWQDPKDILEEFCYLSKGLGECASDVTTLTVASTTVLSQGVERHEKKTSGWYVPAGFAQEVIQAVNAGVVSVTHNWYKGWDRLPANAWNERLQGTDWMVALAWDGAGKPVAYWR